MMWSIIMIALIVMVSWSSVCAMAITMNMLNNVGASQRERIRYVDYHSLLLGRIGRKDLQDKFGIAEAAATRDFTLYNQLAPNNLVYLPSIRSYAITEQFIPVFDHPVHETLMALSNDFEKTSTFTNEEKFRLGSTPSIETISALTRAIHLNRVIECTYTSTSSGKSAKVIAPHSLFDTGLHWYFRGYDRNKTRFADFAVPRIIDIKVLTEQPRENEEKRLDPYFNKILSLKIAAHKNQAHPKTIEFDFGMENGFLIKKIRASFAGYFLRRWNVDCSPEGTLEGQEYQLRLINVDELKGASSRMLAPGYEPKD